MIDALSGVLEDYVLVFALMVRGRSRTYICLVQGGSWSKVNVVNGRGTHSLLERHSMSSAVVLYSPGAGS